MEIPKPGHEYTEHDLIDAFSLLLTPEQHSVLSLSIGNRPSSESQLMQIMRSNAFGDGSTTWLHPTICRINHSCIPNATSHHDADMDDLAQIISEREIKQGEEITISYNNQIGEICTARERAVLLQNQYGFECDCAACSRSSKEGEELSLSDTRRLLISSLRSALTGLTLTPEVRSLLNSPSSCSTTPIPPNLLSLTQTAPSFLTYSQKTCFHLLLARLRLAEGLETTDIVDSYFQAADAQVVQLLTLPDVVILDWARNVRLWMETAMEMLEKVRDPYDANAQMLRKTWKGMQEKLRVKVALEFLDSDASSIVPGSADDVPFALRIFPETKRIQVLSEAECNEVLKQSYGPVSQEDVLEQPSTKNNFSSSKNAYDSQL
ncbi:Putative SET domain-containing protein [Septoria linicola]|uniref:SET domain-containing protein n=1 Tax=Septoria linicola TaxID=215465 RepID=A0A9Q9B5L8_9PEZI|nr:Putative SET domain-containing protein [Septoria linicola]